MLITEHVFFENLQTDLSFYAGFGADASLYRVGQVAQALAGRVALVALVVLNALTTVLQGGLNLVDSLWVGLFNGDRKELKYCQTHLIETGWRLIQLFFVLTIGLYKLSTLDKSLADKKDAANRNYCENKTNLADCSWPSRLFILPVRVLTLGLGGTIYGIERLFTAAIRTPKLGLCGSFKDTKFVFAFPVVLVGAIASVFGQIVGGELLDPIHKNWSDSSSAG